MLVHVRLERKKTVLETYHKALEPRKLDAEKEKGAPKQGKKKSSEMEL